MTRKLHISLLGALEIRQGDQLLRDFVSRKSPALLAYLALAGGVQSRDHLAGLFWGEMADADAKANLRQALTNLRHSVEPYLIISPAAVAFDHTRPYSLDVEEFQAQVSAAASAKGAQAIERLRQAVDLYRGDLLHGFFVRDAPDFEEWALGQRERLRSLAIHAYHSLISHHLSERAYLLGIEYATRLLALDPLSEEAHRHLMLLLARSGQRSAALAQFETCRRLLSEEMGVEPAAETRALYDRLRAANLLPRPTLPPQPTPFVGRELELAQIERCLSDPGCRLLTLVGPSGVGKTRLAIQAATTLGDSFLSGVAYIPLGAAPSAALATTLAEALHVALRPGTNARSQALAHLQGKETLLVLDNFEHVIDARDLLVDILQQAPMVKLLVASTQRLDLQGEAIVDVQGLPTPDGADDGGALRLFAQSARRVRPDFSLAAPEEAAAARQICRQLDGLPLGIELAAAWTRLLPCSSIAREMAQTLDFLTTSHPNVPARHRSLRAGFEYAWQGLSPVEQGVLLRLSVFQGGFGREAASYVGGASLQHLSALVDKSLVRPIAGANRYEIHEVIRQYSAQRLAAAPADRERVQALHGAYYCSFVQQRQDSLVSAEQASALAKMAEEIANVRAAWFWAQESGQTAHLTQCADGLFHFYERRGWFEEGEQVFALASASLSRLAAAAPVWSDAERMLVYRVDAYLADMLMRNGHLERASELALRSLEALRLLRVAIPLEEAHCLDILGRVAWLSGRYPEAQVYCGQSLALRRAVGAASPIAASLHNLAVLASAGGDFAQAQRLQEESLALRRQCGDLQGVALSLESLGTAAQNLGQYQEATRLREESLAIFREIGDLYSAGRALNNLGVAACKTGDFTTAKQHFLAALDSGRAHGHRWLVAASLGNVGIAACGLGEIDEAEQYLRQALALSVESDALPLTLSFLTDLARVYLQRNGQEDARQALELAAFAAVHPSATGETRGKADQLLATIEEALGRETVREARLQAPDRTVQQLLAGVRSLRAFARV